MHSAYSDAWQSFFFCGFLNSAISSTNFIKWLLWMGIGQSNELHGQKVILIHYYSFAQNQMLAHWECTVHSVQCTDTYIVHHIYAVINSSWFVSIQALLPIVRIQFCEFSKSNAKIINCIKSSGSAKIITLPNDHHHHRISIHSWNLLHSYLQSTYINIHTSDTRFSEL